MATPARCRPVASFLRRGSARHGRHPMQRAMVRRDVVDAGVRSVPGLGRGSARHGRHPMQRAMVRRDVVDAGVRSVAGLGVGPPPSDDTPCNGRWSGGMWWTPSGGGCWARVGSARHGRHPMHRAMVWRDVVDTERGRLLGTGRVRRRRMTPHATGDGPAGCGGHRVGAVAGHGSGPPPSDDTPCNGRWSGGMWWTPSGGGCWARVGSAGLGRHPMQRAMVRPDVADARWGRFLGAGPGPPASDDTPCNGRWSGRMWRTPGGVGSRPRAGSADLRRHPMQRAMVRPDVADAWWGRFMGTGRVRRPRTTPHATGDGPAGRHGHGGGAGSRAGARAHWPRSIRPTTWDGADRWRCGRWGNVAGHEGRAVKRQHDAVEREDCRRGRGAAAGAGGRWRRTPIGGDSINRASMSWNVRTAVAAAARRQPRVDAGVGHSPRRDPINRASTPRNTGPYHVERCGLTARMLVERMCSVGRWDSDGASPVAWFEWWDRIAPRGPPRGPGAQEKPR